MIFRPSLVFGVTMRREKVELLAPAGNFEIAKAVINAGADAVYLGGQYYGARAYAGNLSQEEILAILQFAHLRDAKIYLTVNTLLKPDEDPQGLIDYLRPFYEAGLDAVLVQDLGVFRLIRENFPDLPLHVSTQMTITGSNGARLLLDAGAKRIVLARELSLSEIRDIYKKTGAELEVFIHGALCVCYSGQCLYSSFRGGRSGNRGRCAQPCRKKYTLLKEDGQEVRSPGPFVLSPKDICSLDTLPQILEAGVSSLKIEGRMKNINYAADVTAIYRKYLDLALSERPYVVSQEDRLELAGLFNRGGFTEGYFTQDKGASMMTFVRPDNVGVAAIKAVKNVDGRVTFQALVPLHAQDVYEIRRPFTFMGKDEIQPGKTFTVDLPWKLGIKAGQIFPRLKDGAVGRKVSGSFVLHDKAVPVRLAFSAAEGKETTLTLTRLSDGLSVQVSGAPAQKAQTRAAEEAEVAERLKKLGHTPFTAKEVDVRLLGRVFLPVSELNEMRRKAVEQLELAVQVEYHRNLFSTSFKHDTIEKWQEGAEELPEGRLAADVRSLEQLKAVLACQVVDRVYLERTILCQKTVQQVKASGKEAFAALAPVVRQKKRALLKQQVNEAVKNGVDGLLVRNLEELPVAKGTGLPLMLDASLYACQEAAERELRRLVNLAGDNEKSTGDTRSLNSPVEFTCPTELTKDELKLVTRVTDRELIAYGRMTLMVSEQCLKKTHGLCDHGNGRVTLRDEDGREMPCLCQCDYCQMSILDDKPVWLVPEAREAGFSKLRLVFTTEDERTTSAVLSDVQKGTQKAGASKGHWVLGIL